MKQARYKILMLAGWFPNRIQPTNGNFVEKHVRAIARHHSVHVVQVEYDPTYSWAKQSYEYSQQDGYHLHTHYFGAPSGKTGWLWRQLKRFFIATKQAARLHQKHDFQALHAHVLSPTVYWAAYLKWRWQLPFLLTVHATGLLTESASPYPSWWKKQLLQTANRADFICPVSIALQNELQPFLRGTSLRVIPNVVDTQLFCPGTARPATPPLQLLHISSFNDQTKNIKGLLSVVQRLADEHFPFTITLAGDGDLEQVKQWIAIEAPRATNIQLLGTQSEQEVAKLMQTHHVFVLFSNIETQGVVAIEALCCGMQLIATGVGGLAEVANKHPTASTLIPPGDEDALYHAIQQSQSKSAPITTSTAFAQYYDVATVADEYTALYHHMIESRKT